MSEAIGQLVQTLETQSSVPVDKGKGQLSNAMVQIAPVEVAGVDWHGSQPSCPSYHVSPLKIA